ncbi:MAG: hypothetical protein Q9225_002772 [Loekoesia sp. 1 TL-2023]
MTEQNDGEVPAGAQTSTSTGSATPNHEVPDPDEDDLDDLDELLDDFSSANLSANHQSTPPIPPAQHDSLSELGPSNAEVNNFNMQLQEQMAALMGNGEESPEMRTEIQAMLQELGAAVDSTPMNDQLEAEESRADLSAATDESFQEAILRTMERMQASGDKANAAAAADQDSNDILSRMLKEMQGDNQGGTAAGEEEFSKMLMTMMEQLTNKDILYDPMKELHEKFPSWMSNNRLDVKADDLIRYEKQQRLIAEIIGKFEQSTYSDSNAKDREYIVERMQEMQAAGSPPADLVGDMSGAQEALQDLNAGCPQQ